MTIRPIALFALLLSVGCATRGEVDRISESAWNVQTAALKLGERVEGLDQATTQAYDQLADDITTLRTRIDEAQTAIDDRRGALTAAGGAVSSALGGWGQEVVAVLVGGLVLWFGRDRTRKRALAAKENKR